MTEGPSTTDGFFMTDGLLMTGGWALEAMRTRAFLEPATEPNPD
jgi:hypothetical protein